ncbi:MAG: ABC transporter ATP-binding protein/permease [Candidatus Pacebacteria bacterium]|nr:ABC transporter ATP-binding protein/permease [Candidatus Paceibacterota bacterium]
MVFRFHNNRNVPYRPPRQHSEDVAGGFNLYWRFVRAYLWPYRWRLLLCMVIVAINGSSVYLMAFYGRYVVDNILLVPVNPRVETPRKPRFDNAPSRPSNRLGKSSQRATEGLSRTLDIDGGYPLKHAPNAGGRLAAIFILHFATLLIINSLARIANRQQITLGQTTAAAMRDDLHRKVLELSLAYHKKHTAGRLLARIMSDVQVVQQNLMITVITLTQSVSAIAVGATILMAAEWRIAVIAFLAAPLYALVWKKSHPGIVEIAREQRHTNSCMYGLLSQKLDAVKAIQAYARQRKEHLIFHRLSSCFLRDALCQQRQSAAVSGLCAIVSAGATMAIFIMGTWMVVNGGMTLGKMLFVYGAAANLFGPVLMLSHVSIVFSSLLVTLQRLVNILDQPVEIRDNDRKHPFPTPLRQGIRLTNITFTYNESEPILRNVSMNIPGGKWVCVMGPSGCGKTTLLYVVSRLYEPTAGQITVDGVPLENLKLTSLRKHLALVPQEAEMFRGTIRENIAYGHVHAQPSQIVAAAKAAEMHDLIMSMPVKYESLVGEKGTDLSGGQRQRLSLARALLTDPDVLLLDDCTSALDADTEHRIQQTLSRIMKGKTALVVSQRVSMAMRCDYIYVLANGRITQAGTHEELLKQPGFYERLHTQQTE